MTRISSALLLAAFAALPATAQNLLTNVSFDTGLAGWNTDVATWISDAGNPSGSGPGCVEATAPSINGGTWGATQRVAVQAGVAYQISGWAYVPDTADNVADGSALNIQWNDSSGSIGMSSFTPNHTRGEWVQISGQATAPAGAISAMAMFGVRSPNSGSGTPRARWDDVYFGPPQSGPFTVDLFVLAAGYGAGKLGTFWTTDVSIFNPTAATLQIQATFFQGTGDNSAAQPVNLGSLDPAGTMSVPNIVHAAGGTGTGAVRLRFTAPSGAASPAAVVTARTWTPWAGASIGQGAAAISGTSGSSRAVAGLVQNAAFRTNVGMFNTTSSTVQARMRIFDAQGTVLYDQTSSLGPYGQSQVALTTLGINALEGGAMRVDGTGVLAYATPADNVSGDAAFLEAKPIQ